MIYYRRLIVLPGAWSLLSWCQLPVESLLLRQERNTSCTLRLLIRMPDALREGLGAFSCIIVARPECLVLLLLGLLIDETFDS